MVTVFVEKFPVTKFLGIEIDSISNGRAVFNLPFKEELSFDKKTIQAGIVGTLLDFAGAASAMSQLPEGWVIISLGYDIHFISPARGNSLTGIGEVVRQGKGNIVSRVEIFANGDGEPVLCATGTVTTRGVNPNQGSD